MQTKFFFELIPDRILDAVEVLGVRCTGRCLQLNSMENRVYEVEIEPEDKDEQETSRRKKSNFLVVKFYRPGRWTFEQISEEHRFLLDLVECEIPVVVPVVGKKGETIYQLPEMDIWYSVFPKAGGRSPDELSDEQLLQLGRLLARVHNVGSIKPAPHRIKLTPESYGLDSLHFLLEKGVLPIEIRSRYETTVRNICETTMPWFNKVKYQRVHGDCHFGNILWGEQGAFLVDFDDMLQGPCVQDLWLLIPGRDAESKQKLELLLEGYQQMRDFDRAELKLIEPLRAMRMIHFSAWIAKRWDDPAFPRSFPEFGTPRYWNEQLEQLLEQLELILV